MKQLAEFLNAPTLPDWNLIVNDPTEMVIADDSVFFTDRIWGSPSYPGLVGTVVGTGVAILEGYSLVGVPLPEAWAHSPIDVSADGQISPVDALIVINALNDQLGGDISDASLPPQYLRVDVNHDGQLTPADALQVINFLNHTSTTSPDHSSSAEGEAPTVNTPTEFLTLGADEALGGALTSGKKPK